MREQLLGYLLDALDAEEHDQVAQQLAVDADLRTDSDLLGRSLRPLATDRWTIRPQPGLAARTLDFVAENTPRTVAFRPSYEAPHAAASWRFTDVAVAAAVCLFAGLLFLPALSHSRFSADVAQCQENMRALGVGMEEFSVRFGGLFPAVPADGPRGAAGIYAPLLREADIIESSSTFVCPSSSLAEGGHFQVPTLADIDSASLGDLQAMWLRMGGSYGYAFGYISDGRYQDTRNNHRYYFPLLADAPQVVGARDSLNHAGHGQNVLFEDGHVAFLRQVRLEIGGDNIYVNDEGVVAPGRHFNDGVIATSNATWAMALEESETASDSALENAGFTQVLVPEDVTLLPVLRLPRNGN